MPKYSKNQTLKKTSSAETSMKNARKGSAKRRATQMPTISENYGSVVTPSPSLAMRRQTTNYSRAKSIESVANMIEGERIDTIESETNKHDGNWYELRLPGRFPDRRAYHSSFIIDDK